MESGIRTLAFADLPILTTVKQEQLGAVGTTSDGSLYKYIGFGGTATIAPGQLLVAAPVTAAYQTLAITAVGTGGQVAGNLLAGSTQLILTNGATAVTQDQFAEGTLEIKQTSGTGNGPLSLKIKGNTAAAASGFITVFLNQTQPLRNVQTLVPGTDTANLNVSLFLNPAASTTLNVPIGITIVQVPNTAAVQNFGWVQTTGPVLVTNDAAATLAVGTAFAQSTTVAGAVVVAGATSTDIGTIHAAISASAVGPAKLAIV